jgi:hypothetical protein
MGSSIHPNGSSWATIREDLRARRDARAARKALDRDIASFTTPAELSELNSILQRHDDTEVVEIRRIVDRRRVA